MTYLPQGYTNTENLLTFAVVNSVGYLVDPSEIGFRVFDPDGVQLSPSKPGKYHEVTTGDGRLGRGRFYAYTAKPGCGFRVASDAALGEYRIQWRWKVAASDAYSTWSEHFDVVAKYDSGTGLGFRGVAFRTYVSPARVRAEGLTVALLSDSRLEGLILDAQAYIERETRNLFRPVYDVIRLDGNSTGKLFLGLPIIGVDTIYVNENSANENRDAISIAFNRVDRSDVYTSKPDYRRMPSVSFRAETDIFTGSGVIGRSRFRAGRHNQMIAGVWGFLESDGSTPRLIQDAALRLVYATAQVLDVNPGPAVAGPLKSRTVDRHSETWGSDGGAPAYNLKRALARSKEVEEALMLYKAPLAMASPNPSVSRNIFRG